MREVLFRAKALSPKIGWVEGNLFTPDLPEKPYEILIGTNVVRISYEINPETIGQFTGLTDINGTKIFEGDLVKERGDPDTTLYEIRWKDGSFEQKDIELRYGYLLERGSDLEVIGNIHDNPELLKGE